MINLSVLFLSKSASPEADRIQEFLAKNFTGLTVFRGDRTDRLPEEVLRWQGDWLICFIAPWIIPGPLLRAATAGAINFHPGPPEYPGTGCTNFAIYNNETTYGVTLHYMNATVDTGRIIAVRRFGIGQEATVLDVTLRCYLELELLFHEIAGLLLQGQSLPASGEHWARPAFTRRELDELCRIEPDMPREEIDRRIRATTFREPWAYIRLGKYKFRLER